MCGVCYGKRRWQNHKRIIEDHVMMNPKRSAAIGVTLRLMTSGTDGARECGMAVTRRAR